MRKYIRKFIKAWAEARQEQVKAHMVDGHWY
jgi:hypothetical protein